MQIGTSERIGFSWETNDPISSPSDVDDVRSILAVDHQASEQFTPANRSAGRPYLLLLEVVVQEERARPLRVVGVLDALGASHRPPVPRAAALHVDEADGVGAGEVVALAEIPERRERKENRQA